MNVINSGIYIVTLNNEEFISVNSQNKKIAHKTISVNKNNCKVGKAKNFDLRKKNYFKTFGQHNVNFKVLAYLNEIDNAEKMILKELDIFRIKGQTGRKNEWLQNISPKKVEEIVGLLIKNNEIIF